MFPEPTELLLIGCSDRINLDSQKSKSNTSTPRTNSQTSWPKGISHVMSGIIFCVCSTLATSVLQFVLKWCQKERQKESGEERSHSKTEANDESDCKGPRKSAIFCIRKPGEEKLWESESPGVRKLRNIIERWHPFLAVTQVTRQGTTTSNSLKARTQHATQDGDDDKAWSSQEWKASELMDDRTETLVLFALGQGHTSSNHVSLVNTGTSLLKKKKITIGRRSPLFALNEEQGHSNSSLETTKQNWNCGQDPDHSWIGWNDPSAKKTNDLRWMWQKNDEKLSVMGKNYSVNWHSIKNTKDLTMKQMFDISAILVSEQEEINNVDKIHWEKNIHGNICHWLVTKLQLALK